MDIITTKDIEAPADAVWNVLGEQFADISAWAKAILSSSLDGPLDVGGVRTCELKNGALKEELTEFRRQEHSLTYKITDGAPPMISHIQNRWTVEALEPNRSKVTSTVTVQLKWWAFWMAPLVSKMLRRDLGAFVHQLDKRVLEDTPAG